MNKMVSVSKSTGRFNYFKVLLENSEFQGTEDLVVKAHLQTIDSKGDPDIFMSKVLSPPLPSSFILEKQVPQCPREQWVCLFNIWQRYLHSASQCFRIWRHYLCGSQMCRRMLLLPSSLADQSVYVDGWARAITLLWWRRNKNIHLLHPWRPRSVPRR